MLSVDIPEEQRSKRIVLDGGPWNFEFTPVGNNILRTFPVMQNYQSEHFTIFMDGEVKLSNTETIVPLQIQLPPSVEEVFPMDVSMLFEEQSFSGRVKATQLLGDELTPVSNYSFPALPPSAKSFVIETGPFQITRHHPIALELDVAKLQEDGQIIKVGEYDLHFQILHASDEQGFALKYTPVEKDTTFMLKGRGSDSIELVDDQGNAYSEIGGRFKQDWRNNYALTSHRIDFAKPLSDNATRLTLTVGTTSIMSESVRFEIDLGD